MNKRTEEKLKSIEGMKKAMTEILAQAWERGHKMGMLQAQEAQCWIPVKTRELTAEEKEEYPDSTFMWDCPLPNDAQDVLITTSWGDVKICTFWIDDIGSYFDEMVEDDVLAWMPLPKKYTKEDFDNG